MQVKIREANGADLVGWIPGIPLPAWIPQKMVVMRSMLECPIGDGCIRCNGGYQWNSYTGEHAKIKTRGGAAFERRVKK